MKINWDYIKFTLLIVLAVFLFAFSEKRNSNRNLTGLDVKFVEDDNYFITLSAVNKLLIQNNDSVTGIRKDALDLNGMERRLDSNPMIQKAEVFITVDGVLGARIKQRKPIARVVGERSFYLDETGKKMPLSKEYTPRVPLVTGSSESDFEELTELLLKIKSDAFMQSHVVGVHSDKNGEVSLLFRVYDFKAQLGKPENIDRKLQNFKAFYQKTRKDSTLYDYKQVNLKLDNQVVATRK